MFPSTLSGAAFTFTAQVGLVIAAPGMVLPYGFQAAGLFSLDIHL